MQTIAVYVGFFALFFIAFLALQNRVDFQNLKSDLDTSQSSV